MKKQPRKIGDPAERKKKRRKGRGGGASTFSGDSFKF